MAFCTNCGATLQENGQFCVECGEVVRQILVEAVEVGDATVDAPTQPECDAIAVEITESVAPDAPACALDAEAASDSAAEVIAVGGAVEQEDTEVNTDATGDADVAEVVIINAAVAADTLVNAAAGAPVAVEPEAVPQQKYVPSQPQPAQARYGREASPPHGSPYELISTGGYMGIFLLFSVPVVGLIFMIVWACGGCKKLSKRYLSQAMLVFVLLGVAFSTLAYIVVVFLMRVGALPLYHWDLLRAIEAFLS